MKRNHISKFALLASAAMFAAGSVQAANTFLADGDLILFFQKPGNSNTVYAALGSAALNFRGAESGPSANKQAVDFININSSLVDAFGAGWASDVGIYAGLAGVRSNSTNLTNITNGDQNRTLYISQARESVGTVGERNSQAWDLTVAQTQTSGATDIVSMTANFENNLTTQHGVLATSLSVIDERNPFLVPGIQDQAFSAFSGGVQQRGSATAFGVFGDAGQVEFALDLNRILPGNSTNVNRVSGPTLIGSYEGTVTVGPNGDVSFITMSAIPEPSGTLALGLLGTIAGLGYRRRRSS